MREPGEDEDELHLGEREPDAVPGPAPERNPRRVRGNHVGAVGGQVPVGVETQRLVPRARIAARDVGAQEDERTLRDDV